MKLLRDLRESTTFLVLLEATTERHNRLRTLAEKFGMTIQGMSDYVRKMQREGLLRVDERGILPTQKGVEFLHESLRALDAFVRDAQARLMVIDRCSAIARVTISAGERIGLLMENGILVAYPGRASGSTGTALSSARKGEAVAVGDLQGIVDLRPGSITVVKVPSILHGPATLDRNRLRQVAQGRLIAVEGPEAWSAASAADLAVDFRFGPIPAAIDAARRGLDMALIVAENEVSRAAAAIELANKGTEEPIPYDVIAVGRRRARIRTS